MFSGTIENGAKDNVKRNRRVNFGVTQGNVASRISISDHLKDDPAILTTSEKDDFLSAKGAEVSFITKLI